MKYIPGQLWALVTVLLLLNPERRFADPLIVKGKVVEAVTNKPVTDAYIYIAKGEEEAISLNDGSFVLKTWQDLPVACTIEHKDFKDKKISIKEETAKLIVHLTPR